MKTLSKEEIIEKVNAVRPGAFTKIRFISGAPVQIDADTDLYIVKEMLVRFKLNYKNQPTIKWTEQICNATTSSEILDANFAYKDFSKQKQETIPARYVTMLSRKISDAVKGVVIAKSSRIFETRTYDPTHPFIVHCKNGNILLTCYNAFAKNIHTGKEWVPKTFYFAENKKTGKIVSVEPTTLKGSEALKKAEILARKGAKKPTESAPSLVYTIALKNIISIG